MALLNTLGRALRACYAASVHPYAYWGYCSHCMEATPWFTNSYTDEYRCTRCDRDQLRGATD